MSLVSNLERKFILAALEAGNRIDGRVVTKSRDIQYFFDETQRGRVVVHLGSTKVLAVVTSTVTRPYPERPAEGIVNYYVSLSSTAVFHEESAEREEEEATLQRLVDRILKNLRTVDTESLCIQPGEQCWSLRVDLHVLDHDGALIDAVTTAAVAALTDFRRPETSIADDGSVIIHSSFEKHPVPLALHNPSVALSFMLLDPQSAGSDHAVKQIANVVALADPTHLEESIGGGRLTMALSKKGELSLLVKTGGDTVDLDVIQNECFFVARERAIAVLEQMHATMVKARANK